MAAWEYDAAADTVLSRHRASRHGAIQGTGRQARGRQSEGRQAGMAGRGEGPDFVESLARGLDVLQCFDAEHPRLTLSEVATATSLARPTARRLLLTLTELGFMRQRDGQFSLTPRVLSLGMAFVASLGLWEVGRPHLEQLVAATGESSSMSQLDGSDIVYVRAGPGRSRPGPGRAEPIRPAALPAP